MSHIFISYSRKDLDIAQKIVDALAENNLDTWIDWKSIPKGEDWEQEIYFGIEEAEAFLFLISPDSVISDMCNKEIAHAVMNEKRILPIVIRDTERRTVPDEISKRNWIFCRVGQDDFNKAIEETRETIRADYEWLKFHTELQVKALKWEQRKDASRLLRGKELQEAEKQLANRGGQKDPQPSGLQRQFVLNSRRYEERRRNRVLVISIIAGIIMITLGIYAQVQGNLATDRAGTAQAASTGEARQASTAKAASTQAIMERDQARSGELAAVALSNLNDNLGLSLLLSIEAYKKSDTLQARSALLRTLVAYPSISQLLYSELSGEFEFSPDSQILAANTRAGEIILWDVNTGRMVRRLSIGPWSIAKRLVFSADGKVLAIAGCDTTQCQRSGILFLDLITGDQLGLLFVNPELQPPIFTLSPDGKSVFLAECGKFDASRCIQGQVVMLDIATGNAAGEPWLVHSGKPFQLAYDRTGNKLVSIGCNLRNATGFCIQDDAVSIDPGSGERITRLLPANADNSTNNWLISPDNSAAIRYYKDEISIWDIPLEKEIGTYRINLGINEIPRWEEASVSRGGKFLAIPETQGLLILDQTGPTTGYATNETILGDKYFIRTVKISPDGQKFAAQRTGNVWLFTYQTFESFILGNTSQPAFTYKLKGTEGGASAWDPGISAFNPDGKSFVTVVCLRQDNINSCTQEGLALWDAKSLTLLQTLTIPENVHLTSIVYSPNGKILATGDTRGQITFWDMFDRKPVHKIESINGSESVLSLAFSPDDRLLAVVREPVSEIVMDIWNTARQICIKTISFKDIPLEDRFRIKDIAFSPYGNLLAAAIPEKSQIVLWDISNWEIVAMLENPTANGVRFNPDGKTLAAAGWDGSITIWDLSSFKQIGKPITTLFGGIDEWSSSLAFMRGGTELIVGFENISIWDISTRLMVGQQFGRPSRNIALSPDGKTLVSGSSAWDLDPQSWVSYACQIAGRNFTRAEWQQFFADEQYRPTCSQWSLEPEVTPTPEPAFGVLDITPTVTKSIGRMININTATLEELESLPSINPAVAQGIIEYRELNGPFLSKEDILLVPGLGPYTFERIKDLITVE